jgi:hypothetical protein
VAISKRLRFEVLRRDDHRCTYCGATADDGAKLVIDHVVPEALGGQTEPENLTTACEACNSGKSSSAPDSARVAAVNETAARWADALALAAMEMLTERQDVVDEHQWFKDEWNLWHRSAMSKPWPLPTDWAEAVGRFTSLGLPKELLADAISTAMQRRGVDDRFRYFCGVAWGMVRNLQDRARAIADGRTIGKPSKKDPVGFLEDILDRCDPQLTAWEYDRIIVEFREALIPRDEG